MQRPRETDVTRMLEWKKGFFNNRFTHPSGMGKLTSHAGGFIGLWAELAEKQLFPTQYLLPAGQTLQQYVGEAL